MERIRYIFKTGPEIKGIHDWLELAHLDAGVLKCVLSRIYQTL